MTKRAIIALLIALNLILLGTLIISRWQPPMALAQAIPSGRNYAMVTGEIRDGVDALYIVDLAQRRMHVFVPNRDQNNRRLLHMGFRDLEKDFRGGR